MTDIKGYEGLYAITTCGKVWSYRSKKFLKPMKTKLGYLTVILSIDGKKKSYRIHRLVAQAYIPNPDNLAEVNHKDENKEHNWINNLEWCDRKYNINYGERTKKTGHAVYCIELNKQYDAIKQAARELGLSASDIRKVCNGKNKTCGGYHFRYMEVA